MSNWKDLNLQPGDRVMVTFSDITIRQITFDECLRYDKEDGHTGYIRLNQPNTTVCVVERAARPEHWPPRNGDVWTDGTTYVAATSSGLQDVDGGIFPNKEHLIRNHPKMKLVYRKGNALR